eukprot:5097524-Pleurochrysis_carterae.AAC.1
MSALGRSLWVLGGADRGGKARRTHAHAQAARACASAPSTNARMHTRTHGTAIVAHALSNKCYNSRHFSEEAWLSASAICSQAYDDLWEFTPSEAK